MSRDERSCNERIRNLTESSRNVSSVANPVRPITQYSAAYVDKQLQKRIKNV